MQGLLHCSSSPASFKGAGWAVRVICAGASTCGRGVAHLSILQVEANQEQHRDLCWAMRGVGSAFGVVTKMQCRLHDVSDCLGGTFILPYDKVSIRIVPCPSTAARSTCHAGLQFAGLRVPQALAHSCWSHAAAS